MLEMLLLLLLLLLLVVASLATRGRNCPRPGAARRLAFGSTATVVALPKGRLAVLRLFKRLERFPVVAEEGRGLDVDSENMIN